MVSGTELVFGGGGGAGGQTDPGCADDLPELDVHPVVTVDQVSIVSLPVLQLHQLQGSTSNNK